ncbi:hypothetical protein V6N13_052792 [Hibiscus sabdariffa]
MLATVMNAIFLQAMLKSIDIPTRVQTAFRMSEVAEPYMPRRAVRHLVKGRVSIFAAGTDVLKATNADGVYDGDPRHNASAFLHDTLTYHETTSKDLSGLDMTAKKITFPLSSSI